MSARNDDHLLTLDGISRRFGDVVALDDVRLTVRQGSVHALLGENGAGKSTLMRIAFGMLQADRGEMELRNALYRPTSPAQAMSSGIGMVHQHFTLVPSMTVAENIALGGKGRFDPAATAKRVRELSALAGLPVDPQALVSDLPVSAQQRCEILKSLSRDASLLIMDEPTAVLAPDEASALLSWLREFADGGNGVVLITHKLRDALSIADEVTVLRHGRVALSARRDGVDEASLAAAMLGSSRLEDRVNQARGTVRAGSVGGEVVAEEVVAEEVLAGEVVAEEAVADLRGVSVRDVRGLPAIRDISLQLRGGEIVVIAAVEGSGQHELLRVVASRMTADAGIVRLPGFVGFIPEDRHRDALMLDANLVENTALHGAAARTGRMNWSAVTRSAASLMERFDVRASSSQSTARALSGGNQQKFIVGRELMDAPRLLVADNPTRGLDFNASLAVHAALRDARESGTAILLYSSDLDEVIELADRILVLRDGRLLEAGGDREQIGHAMLSAP